MDVTTIAIITRLGIALAIGMLVGLHREKSDPLLAGVRTFALIGLAVTLTAMLELHVLAMAGASPPERVFDADFAMDLFWRRVMAHL